MKVFGPKGQKFLATKSKNLGDSWPQGFFLKSSPVTGHIFVISQDTKHDHHSVHQVRELVAGYLKEMKYDVEVMHEWTDGCSVQYKSQHCMGDVSFSNADFDYRTIRNYFGTSHAKGPQDGVGANLMPKTSLNLQKII